MKSNYLVAHTMTTYLAGIKAILPTGYSIDRHVATQDGHDSHELSLHHNGLVTVVMSPAQGCYYGTKDAALSAVKEIEWALNLTLSEVI